MSEQKDELSDLDWMKLWVANLHLSDDRSAAITSAAMLESVLEQALIGRLISNSDLRDRMFGGNGFLNNFSAKIDVGYCVGLYNKKTHHDLHVIRRVRNRFAHEFGPLAFDHQEITTLCKSMQTLDYEHGVVVKARSMYVSTFALMMWYLAKISKFKIRPVKDETDLPAGFREYVPYL
jgi:hypothetical protein